MVIHEFGHYAMARLLGVRAYVFSVGFGPQLLSYLDKKGTLWKVSMIPLGGYVRLSNPEQNIGNIKRWDKAHDDLQYRPPLHKILIYLAGPFANVILAFMSLLYLVMIHGIPVSQAYVDKIVPNSPAATSGLQVDDKIIKANNQPIETYNDLVSQIIKSNGKTIKLIVKRKNNGALIDKEIKITPHKKSGRFMIGIMNTGKHVIYKTQDLGHVFHITGQLSTMMIVGLKNAVVSIAHGHVKESGIGGPLTIAKYSEQAMTNGLVSFITLLSLLSLNLAIMNLLPIPVLDGGAILIHTIELIWNKQLNENMQKMATILGVSLVFALMGLGIWIDILKMLE